VKIALVSPPVIAVPPKQYAGTERVVAALGGALHTRGHDVTLFAPGDSVVPYELVPTVERSLWSTGFRGDLEPWMQLTAAIVERQRDRFDIVHFHLEGQGFSLGDGGTPVVSTLHGRLDQPPMPALLRRYRDARLISISDSQRRWFPHNRWLATVPHGLPFSDEFLQTGRRSSVDGYLAVIGRATHDKGIAEAIEVAKHSGKRLIIAAKARSASEVSFVDRVIRPALHRGRVEFLGEVTSEQRDALLAGADAALMLGGWPEPFGLVAIESLAVGTPVIARRAGALPEIVEHGVDGFLVDDVAEAVFALSLLPGLDRQVIAKRVRRRFSVERMVERYEAVYHRVLGDEELPVPIDGAADDAVAPSQVEPELGAASRAAGG
jgi:glycosyltransferase involved in cell wall biosynthesis